MTKFSHETRIKVVLEIESGAGIETRGTIRRICERHKGRYGYRRVTLELQRQGQHVNRKLVMKLMHEEKLTCRIRAKTYRSYRGELGKIAPNLLDRDFHAEAPNLKWTTDVTQLQLFGQKLFLSPILFISLSQCWVTEQLQKNTKWIKNTLCK